MIFRSNLLRKLMVGLLSSSLLLGAQVSFAQSASNKQTTQQAAKKKVAPKKQKQVRTSTTRAKSAKAPDEKRPSFAAAMGLRGNQDDLNLKSSVALIVDRQTHEVLFEKNAHAALPIASITKLMTSLVVLEAQLPLDETIVIEQSDVNAYPGRTRSRVTQGAKMSREQAMLLSLMSSENRASQALGRNFPGGIPAFVDAMNAKAKSLGMNSTHYMESTGLHPGNVASARDLGILVNAASQYGLIRQFSTTASYDFNLGYRVLKSNNTNALVRNGGWNINISKTGFINEAGRCVVMHTTLNNRPAVVVLLGADSSAARTNDATRLMNWASQLPKRI